MIPALVGKRACLLVPLAVLLLAAPFATAQVGVPTEQAPTSAATQRIAVTAGQSTVLSTDFDVTRIAVTNPEVANALVVDPRSVLIDGKAPGTITLLVWGENQRRQYAVVVGTPPSLLQQRLQALFPSEGITVSASDNALILSGRASSADVASRAVEIAAASSDKAKVVNLLQLPNTPNSQQVLLQVRFAEVNRRALTELGASLFTSPTGVRNTIGRTTTQQFAAPGYDNLQATKSGKEFGSAVTSASGNMTFSDFLNVFLFSEKYDLGALIRALSTKGLFQSLAEPNLIAYNGQEASFLAGGEIPIPIVQGGIATNAVTIEYKEFGIRLNFRPTIIGDTIRLHVRPEVSSLDFTNGIILSGFRIPAITARHAETEVELRDGQSFAIAGLIDNSLVEDASKIPGLGDIPILGKLFSSRATTKNRTELMVLITPHLVRPLNPADVPALPALQKPFLPPTAGIGSQLKGGGGTVDAPPVSTPAAAAGGTR